MVEHANEANVRVVHLKHKFLIQTTVRLGRIIVFESSKVLTTFSVTKDFCRLKVNFSAKQNKKKA